MLYSKIQPISLILLSRTERLLCSELHRKILPEPWVCHWFLLSSLQNIYPSHATSSARKLVRLLAFYLNIFPLSFFPVHTTAIFTPFPLRACKSISMRKYRHKIKQLIRRKSNDKSVELLSMQIYTSLALKVIFFLQPEFAREIFQLISILRFLVVTTVLLRREGKGKKNSPVSQFFRPKVVRNIKETLLLFWETWPVPIVFPFQSIQNTR